MSVWRNDLQHRSLEDYDLLRDRQFSWFRKQEGVLGYGTFGSVGAPGLSDLDLAVVVEDRTLAHGRFQLAPAEEIDSYLMTHPPLVIPHSLLPQLSLYHPVQIEWSQTEIPLAVPECDAAITGLHLLRKTCHLMFHLHLLNKVASARKAIMSLTSLLRSVEISQRIGLSVSQDARQYADAVLSLRAAWVEQTKCGEELARGFPELIQQARLLAPELLESIALQLFGPEIKRAALCGARLQLTPLKLLHCVDTQRLPNAVSRYHSKSMHKEQRPFLRLMTARHIPIGQAAWGFFLQLASLDSILGERRWPRLHPLLKRHEIRDTLGESFHELLSKMLVANREYARVLFQAGLPEAYFGSYWRLPLRQSLLFCTLARLQVFGSSGAKQDGIGV